MSALKPIIHAPSTAVYGIKSPPLNSALLLKVFQELNEHTGKLSINQAATSNRLSILEQQLNVKNDHKALLKHIPVLESLIEQLKPAAVAATGAVATGNHHNIGKLIGGVYNGSWGLVKSLYNVTGVYEQFYAKFREPVAHKKINGYMYVLSNNNPPPSGSIPIPGTNFYWEPVYGIKDLKNANPYQLQNEVQTDIKVYKQGSSIVRIPTANYLIQLNKITKEHQMCATALIQLFKMGMQLLSTLTNQVMN
jgi:hypothetical protein